MGLRTHILTAVISIVGATAVAQDVTLKLHHALPADAEIATGILDIWADRVEADAEIKIQRAAAMSLGGEPGQLIDQAIGGEVDIVWTAIGLTPLRFQVAEMFELPFLIENPATASCAFWKMFERQLSPEFAELKILATVVGGGAALHSKMPLPMPADLRGLKIRGGSLMMTKLLETAAATPVGLQYDATKAAVTKGVIDGAILSWDKAADLAEFTMHAEFESAALTAQTYVLAMNKARFDALPDDMQSAIDANSGLSLSVFSGKLMGKSSDRARANRAAGNDTITRITDLTAWHELAEPVYDQWRVRMERQDKDGAAMLADAQNAMGGECRDVAVDD